MTEQRQRTGSGARTTFRSRTVALGEKKVKRGRTAHVAAGDRHLQEVGVLGITFDVNFSSVISKEVCDVSWIRRLHDQLQSNGEHETPLVRKV